MWLPHEQLRNRAHVLYHVEDLLNAMDLWCAVVTGIPNRVCALHEHFRALHVMVPYTPARRSAERAPCSCLTCPRVLAPPSSLLAPQPQRVQATAVPTALLAGCCVLELVQLSVVHVTDLSFCGPTREDWYSVCARMHLQRASMTKIKVQITLHLRRTSGSTSRHIRSGLRRGLSSTAALYMHTAWRLQQRTGLRLHTEHTFFA